MKANTVPKLIILVLAATLTACMSTQSGSPGAASQGSGSGGGLAAGGARGGRPAEANARAAEAKAQQAEYDALAAEAKARQAQLDLQLAPEIHQQKMRLAERTASAKDATRNRGAGPRPGGDRSKRSAPAKGNTNA
jgi:hypothetical protein